MSLRLLPFLLYIYIHADRHSDVKSKKNAVEMLQGIYTYFHCTIVQRESLNNI